jgi:hypothetical protein
MDVSVLNITHERCGRAGQNMMSRRAGRRSPPAHTKRNGGTLLYPCDREYTRIGREIPRVPDIVFASGDEQAALFVDGTLDRLV